MTGSHDLDTRAFPLFIQGIITGIATALVVVAFTVYQIDSADGTLADGTEILAFVAAIMFSVALWVYIPITRAEALERDKKRRARARRRQQPTPLRLVPTTRHSQHHSQHHPQHHSPRRPAAG